MKRLITLSLRNLTRNLRRTIITLLAVGVGLGMMVVTINLANGQYQAAIGAGISSLAGHVVVQAPGWQEDREEEQLVVDSEAVAATLGQLFPDATVARRMTLGGLLVSATSSVGAGLQGVEPEPEAEVNTFDEKVIEGTWLDGDPKGIVIGAGMARTLDVGVGDKLVYMGQHGDEMSSKLFRIKGIFRTGGPEIDGFLAFTDLAATQELLGAAGSAHQVTLHLQDARGSRAAAASAATALATDLDVRWWREAIPEMWAMIQVDKTWTNVMMGILGLIVAMGVLNTLLMSVLERTREFGVLLAIGMKPSRLAVLIVLEGVFIGVLGGLLGLGLGALMSWPLAEYGLDYTQYMGESMEYAGVTISSVFYAEYDWTRSLRYVLAGIVFTTIASAYPAWYVTRLTPVDAMRHH